MADDESWLRKNWTTPVILLVLFLFALYLRAYFPWSLALPDGLLSGGSDAFYYHRIITYNVETGQQLVLDCRLNYPICLTNPRPPLYSWTVSVVGVLFTPLIPDAVTIVELLSTAVWGALTVFPTYFLAKEGFGRRTGLLAAFLLAVLPAHLQRSPATNGDHDAMVLFFVVAGFFFFLKSLKSLNERRWVEDWAVWRKASRISIRQGLVAFFRENRRALLYAVMAGWCIATVALTWQGWAYAPIILLVYFLFQILVHRVRNLDPMGIVIVFAVAMGLPLLVSFPWYASMNQIKVWYDVPAYLFIAALGIGLVFTATRDYPWALVVPSVAIAGGVALAVLSVLYPGVATAFVSGAGYFVRSKAYETIAEAQPPGLSQVILSFGVATYFMGLFGLLWMARGIPKRPVPDYLFLVVWAIAAIFMAQAAARFIFNASPAFAIASAWVTVLLLDWLRFDDMRKTFRSLSAGGRLAAFRRSVKVRHVLGSLLALFLLLLPNVWYGVDASIPFERKAEYDRQVFNAYPEFLRPSGYEQSVRSGGSFFFGAFGYSLPLEKEYFPSAWRWFREQDAHTIPENRPAFLSWWDYGFEAVDEGAHPTVADNFLDGYHLAGNFITAQGEAEAIALLNLRLLEGDFHAHRTRFGDPIRALLDAHGIPWASLEDAFRNPAKYAPIVEGDPFTYGHYQRVQPQNAQYIYGRVVLTGHLDADGLATLNHGIRKITGASIRYFAVDTRLFPIDGSNTGIFYAPAKLSDHRVLELRDGRTLPIDFFEVLAQTQRGQVPLQNLRPDDQVSALQIQYKELFYRSMFYRAYAGFAPSDVLPGGQVCNDCIPGIPSSTNQQIGNIQPMQAWNLSHFKLAYRTAYYNPFPGTEVQNHTDAWRAISHEEAEDLQGKINRGEATGVVDLSAASAIRRGIVFLKYYDGAFVNGTVNLDGVPWPGVRVTAHDELGVPHDSVVTAADGRFSLVAPFGRVHVQATVGPLDNRTMSGSTTIGEFEVTVSDAASMREEVDADADGALDWLIERDIDVRSETLDGFVYVDGDHDGSRDADEITLGGAEVTLSRTDGFLTRTGASDATGHLQIRGVYEGAYTATLRWRGRSLTVTNLTVAQAQGPLDLAVHGTTLQGYLQDSAGHRLGPGSVTVTDLVNGTVSRATTSSDGFFAFPHMLSGAFDVSGSTGDQHSLPQRASIPEGERLRWHNVTVFPSATVTLQTNLAGAPQPFVTVEFEQRSAARLVRVATTDASAVTSFPLPPGTWNVHARHWSGTTLWAYVGTLTVEAGQSVAFSAGLTLGASLSGTLLDVVNGTASVGSADIFFRGPTGEYRVLSDISGRYLAILPRGTWTVQISHLDFTFLGQQVVTGDAVVNFSMPRGVIIDGRVSREYPANATVQIEDPIPDAVVTFFNGSTVYRTLTQSDGAFEVSVPGTANLALRIEHPAFHTHEAPAKSPFQWQGSRISLVARNVTVSGRLLRDGVPVTDSTIPVRFRPVGPGGLNALANLTGNGFYSASLAPARYEVEVDRDETGNGDARLQLRRATAVLAAVGGGAIEQDLELTVRLRVSGTLTLGQPPQPRSAPILFEGTEVRTANATDGSFAAYVVPGPYTASANYTQDTVLYLALQAVNVTAPTEIALSLLRATNVTGSVTDAITEAPVPGAPISFSREGGGRIVATSDQIGSYHAPLIGGTYSVAVDHPGTSSVDGVSRHVRFTFAGSITVSSTSPFQVFPIRVAKALENTTVTGDIRYRGAAPVFTHVTFFAKETNGMNGTANVGPSGAYTVALQPGSYDVYAFAAFERAAFLGGLTVAAGGPVRHDLNLTDAGRVAGVTSVVGRGRTSANLTFTATLGAAAVRSSATGDYEILLPITTYSVVATTPGIERGVEVQYRASDTADLSAPAPVNLDLTKVVRRGVRVVWDSAQKVTIGAGKAVNYTVVVHNTGNVDDTYEISAIGPDFTFAFAPDRPTIPFGTTGNQTTVRVQITANRDARVEHSPISLSARSTADSSTTNTATLALDVARFRGFQANVSSSAPTWDGLYLRYTLDVRNLGNAAETYHISVPNLDELAAAGWRALLEPTEGVAASEIDVVVPANATQRPVLRLEKAGGAAGALARVLIVDNGEKSSSAIVNVGLQMPVLAVEGGVRAAGPGITTRQPVIDLATAAFLISMTAMIAAAAYLVILRRRSK